MLNQKTSLVLEKKKIPGGKNPEQQDGIENPPELKRELSLMDADRPYKAFGYPYLPAAYIIMGLIFCTLLIIYKPNFTWGGLIIVLLGLPIYYLKDKSWKLRR